MPNYGAGMGPAFVSRGPGSGAYSSAIYGGEGMFGLEMGRQSGNMYYAPFTPAIYQQSPDMFGLGELSPGMKTGLTVLSVGAIIGGLVLPFMMMKKAPMPPSMKKVIRTGAAEWRETTPAGLLSGVALVVAGFVGLSKFTGEPTAPAPAAPAKS